MTTASHDIIVGVNILMAIPGVFDNRRLDLVVVPTHSLFVYENSPRRRALQCLHAVLGFYFLADVLVNVTLLGYDRVDWRYTGVKGTHLQGIPIRFHYALISKDIRYIHTIRTNRIHYLFSFYFSN